MKKYYLILCLIYSINIFGAAVEEFFEAIQSGNKELVEAKLKADPKLVTHENHEGRSTLHKAICISPEIVKLLLDAKADPGINSFPPANGTVLMCAYLNLDQSLRHNDQRAIENNKQILELLFQYSTPPQEFSQIRLLRDSIRTGMDHMFHEIISKNPELANKELNAPPKKYYPLNLAISCGQNAMMESLLQAKADVNAQHEPDFIHHNALQQELINFKNQLQADFFENYVHYPDRIKILLKYNADYYTIKDVMGYTGFDCTKDKYGRRKFRDGEGNDTSIQEIFAQEDKRRAQIAAVPAQEFLSDNYLPLEVAKIVIEYLL